MGAERCDACSAASRVTVFTGTGYLRACLHHAKKWAIARPDLEQDPDTVDDGTGRHRDGEPIGA